MVASMATLSPKRIPTSQFDWDFTSDPMITKVMEQMRDDFETDVKSILTKDQQKQFDSFMKEKESNRSGQGKPKK